jgi:hypothetical protein
VAHVTAPLKDFSETLKETIKELQCSNFLLSEGVKIQQRDKKVAEIFGWQQKIYLSNMRRTDVKER